MSLYDDVDEAVAAGLASPVPTLPEWAREDLRRYRTAYAEGRAKAQADLAAAGYPTVGDAALRTLQGRPPLARKGARINGTWH